METTQLGRTGIEVSRLCMGGWQASGWSSSDDDRFVRTVEHALDQGINFIDTAEGYGRGHSEELVAKGIAGKRDKVVLATKFSPNHSDPASVRATLEEQLTRLGTDYIDVYQQHWPPKAPPLADTIGELEKLRDEGKIRVIGVSNWMEPEWDEIDDPSRIDTLQPCHNLLWRSIENSILPLCRKHGIAVLPYSSLCQGVLAGRFRSLDQVPERDPRSGNVRLKADVFPRVLQVLAVLEDVSNRYGKTMAQTAIRWLLDQEGVTAPIVGASRPEQVDQNLGALGWHLEPEDWETLSTASWPLSADLNPHDTMWNWHPKYR